MSEHKRRRANSRQEHDAMRRAEIEKARVIRAAKERARRERRKRETQKRLTLFFVLCLVIIVVMIFAVVSLFKIALSRKADVPVDNPVDASQSEASAETNAPTEATMPESQPVYTPPSVDESRDQTQSVKPTVASFSSDSRSVSLSGTVRSECAILVDVSAGRIVASRGADKKVYPASLTKVMSLVTAYEHVKNIDREYITMTYDILNPLIVSGNSLAGFEVGESVSVREYMYGMIMPSGADAAEAIAVYCGGSIAGFADMMNKKAAELGMKNSHFSNPVGDFSEENYSTVYDLSVLLAYAYQYPDLAEILSAYRHTTPATEYHPDGIYFESNLQQRMKGDESGSCNVLGGKTGYTSESGHCVMCYATSVRDGRPYIFVSCKGKALYDPINDCIDVLKKYVE